MSIRTLKWEYFIVLVLMILVLTKIKLVTFLDINLLLQSVIILGFFLFSFLGMIGIYKQNHWGYFSIYIFIAISTVGLGIAPIPLIEYLLPNMFATYLVIFTSIILLSFTLYLQIKLFKKINKHKY